MKYEKQTIDEIKEQLFKLVGIYSILTPLQKDSVAGRCIAEEISEMETYLNKELAKIEKMYKGMPPMIINPKIMKAVDMSMLVIIYIAIMLLGFLIGYEIIRHEWIYSVLLVPLIPLLFVCSYLQAKSIRP